MIKSRLNRTRAASFFVGATLFWLVAFFLHKAGFIYIYTQDHQAQFRLFNEAMTRAQGDIRQFEEVLRSARKTYEQALAEGRLASLEGGRLIRVEEALPNYYGEFAKPLMDRTNTFFYLIKKGTGYKFLLNADICPAVALTRPDLIDARRGRYSPFCRYFGIWNPDGAGL
ncbi:MAG: hypothetical protein AB7I34_02530 [Rhizobiaceae bacterium]